MRREWIAGPNLPVVILVRQRDGDQFYLCRDREEERALTQLELSFPDRRVLVVERRQGISILGVLADAGSGPPAQVRPTPRFAIVKMTLPVRAEATGGRP